MLQLNSSCASRPISPLSRDDADSVERRETLAKKSPDILPHTLQDPGELVFLELKGFICHLGTANLVQLQWYGGILICEYHPS